MTSTFVILLARFIELYRNCPERVEYLLGEDRFWSETVNAAMEGDAQAREAAKNKAFLQNDRLAKLDLELRSKFAEVEAGQFSAEWWDSFFAAYPGVGKMADELGWTRDELIRQIRCVRDEESRKPDFEVFLARDFASLLGQTASRLENLEEIEFPEILSPHLKTLLQEAHRCYLYGFELACSALCGAILEETLRTVLMTSAKLEEASWDALKKGLITDEQYRMADEVRELRNEALHEPRKFAARSNLMRASVISNTRTVLVAINPQLGTD